MVNSFHGIVALLKVNDMPIDSVTYVSEQLLPISQVYTIKGGKGGFHIVKIPLNPPLGKGDFSSSATHQAFGLSMLDSTAHSFFVFFPYPIYRFRTHLQKAFLKKSPSLFIPVVTRSSIAERSG
jgi:hypothetical protein